MRSPSKAGPPTRQARGLIAFPSNTGAVCIRPGRQGAVLSWCATYTSLSVLLGRKNELFRSSVFLREGDQLVDQSARIVNISAFGGKGAAACSMEISKEKKKKGEAGFFFRSKTAQRRAGESEGRGPGARRSSVRGFRSCPEVTGRHEREQGFLQDGLPVPAHADGDVQAGRADHNKDVAAQHKAKVLREQND